MRCTADECVGDGLLLPRMRMTNIVKRRYRQCPCECLEYDIRVGPSLTRFHVCYVVVEPRLIRRVVTDFHCVLAVLRPVVRRSMRREDRALSRVLHRRASQSFPSLREG